MERLPIRFTPVLPPVWHCRDRGNRTQAHLLNAKEITGSKFGTFIARHCIENYHAEIFTHEYRQDATRSFRMRQTRNEPAMTALMKTSAIPLVHAVLCLDCNCVTDANRDCPVCSSRALMNLSSVLDRGKMLSHSLKRPAA